MSAQTKVQKIIPWLLATIIAIVLLYPLNFITKEFLLFAPINLALGTSAVQAIAEFGGETTTESFWTQRIAIVVSMILLFVVAPILWVNNASDDESILGCIGWYSGVSLVMIGFITTSMGLAHILLNSDQKWQMAEIHRARDYMRSELATLQSRAMEQYWLPPEQGGAGRDISSISLADLKQDDAFKNEFVLKSTPEDSNLVIYAVNERAGENPNFENANQNEGRMQIAIQVFPEKLEVDRIRTDSLTN